MNKILIAGIIVSLILLIGVAITFIAQPVQADTVGGTPGSCAYSSGSGCPYANGQGGCTQGSNCGLSTCAAKYGGSCGCSGQR